MYRSETLSRTQAFEWHHPFRKGRESVEHDKRCERPVISAHIEVFFDSQGIVHLEFSFERLTMNKELLVGKG